MVKDIVRSPLLLRVPSEPAVPHSALDSEVVRTFSTRSPRMPTSASGWRRT